MPFFEEQERKSVEVRVAAAKRGRKNTQADEFLRRHTRTTVVHLQGTSTIH